MRIAAKWRLSVCLLACTLSRPANAYFYTGNQLLALCESSDLFEDGSCVGASAARKPQRGTQYTC
jgi:hypothetical protein